MKKARRSDELYGPHFCTHCKTPWHSRVRMPKQCPYCKSKYWKERKTRRKVTKRG